MPEQFHIIIEDDWELMGTGEGNVAALQYLPSLFLMNLAAELKIKLTFMVDVAQQLTFIQLQDKHPNIKLQSNLWKEAVSLMKYNNFDVQLHLHPQWYGGTYKHPYFYLNRNWNIATYPMPVRRSLLKQSKDYLEQLLKPIDHNYSVHSFKPGSWAMQPSSQLFHDLTASGIKIVIGVRKGMYKKSLSIDYTHLQEDTLPYVPDFEDITRVTTHFKDLIMIPLAYYSPNALALGALLAARMKASLSKNRYFLNPDIDHPPPEIRYSPHHRIQNPTLSLKPYFTHLTIGNQPYLYLKHSFDTVLKRLTSITSSPVPIVIESHTKNYINNFPAIKQFFCYIVKRYQNSVKFIDLTTFLTNLRSNIYNIRGLNDS